MNRLFVSLVLLVFLGPTLHGQNEPDKKEKRTPGWTSYFVSTNPYAKYLNSEFSFESQIPLSPDLKETIIQLFRNDYTKSYDIFNYKTEDEDTIYELIDTIYGSQELFNVFHEYLEILTELEDMGSYIVIHEVDFKKIDVLKREKDTLTIEAVWTVNGTVRHITHDHNQQNANCVQFKVKVDNDDAPKINSSRVISIDRFDLYK